DPCSHFSYVDFLRFEIWCLENLNMGDIDTIRQMVLIDNLFMKAEASLYENQHIISTIKDDYIARVGPKTKQGSDSFFEYVNRLEKNNETRPYALIVRFNYFDKLGQGAECVEIAKELEHYTYLDEVVKVLFSYYGRNLYDPNIRAKFFGLVSQNSSL